MGKFKSFLLKAIIIPFMPLYYILTAISPNMKAAGLSGKSFKLRDRGDYYGSIALSNEIIWMASRPHRRLNNVSALFTAYNNLVECYVALEEYEAATDNIIVAMNILHGMFPDDWELDNKLGDYYSNFIRRLQKLIEYTDRDIEPAIRYKLDQMVAKVEKYELGKVEGSVP